MQQVLTARAASHVHSALRGHAGLGWLDHCWTHKTYAHLLIANPLSNFPSDHNRTTGLTTNAIVMIGYAVGNAAGPQYWQKKYQPRNHVPWLILSICWAVSALLLLATRAYLAWENARRERAGPDERYDDVYVTEKRADGSVVDKKVDKVRCAFPPKTRSGTYGGQRRRSWTSRTCKTATSATCFNVPSGGYTSTSCLLPSRRLLDDPPRRARPAPPYPHAPSRLTPPLHPPQRARLHERTALILDPAAPRDT